MHPQIMSPDGLRRFGRLAAGAGVRSWTGRSALSCVTDSALPHLTTSGTHRTRVSEMRLVMARTRARSIGAHASPVTASERRNPGAPRRSG